MGQETPTKPLSRSEREALVKDKAGWVITVLAALLAVNTLNQSSKILLRWLWIMSKNLKRSEN